MLPFPLIMSYKATKKTYDPVITNTRTSTGHHFPENPTSPTSLLLSAKDKQHLIHSPIHIPTHHISPNIIQKKPKNTTMCRTCNLKLLDTLHLPSHPLSANQAEWDLLVQAEHNRLIHFSNLHVLLHQRCQEAYHLAKTNMKDREMSAAFGEYAMAISEVMGKMGEVVRGEGTVSGG